MAPSAAVLVLALSTIACEEAGRTAEPAASSTVQVQGLTLEIDGPQGRRVVVMAEEAELSDLPGRGHGRLRGVVATAPGSVVGESVRVTAREAQLLADSTIVLEAGQVSSDTGGMHLQADQVRLHPEGRLVASGVRARLEVQ